MKSENQMPTSESKSKAPKVRFYTRIICASLLATVFAAPGMAQQINLPRGPANPTSEQECLDLQSAYQSALKDIDAEWSRGSAMRGEALRMKWSEGGHELYAEGNRITAAAMAMWNQVADQKSAAVASCRQQVRSHQGQQRTAERERQDQQERQRQPVPQQQAETTWSNPFTAGQMPAWGQSQSQSGGATKFERTVAGVQFGMNLFSSIMDVMQSSRTSDDDARESRGSTYSPATYATLADAEDEGERLATTGVGVAGLGVATAMLDPYPLASTRDEYIANAIDKAEDGLRLKAAIAIDSVALNAGIVHTTGLGIPADSPIMDGVERIGRVALNATSPLTSPISQVALGGTTTVLRQVVGQLDNNVIQPMNDFNMDSFAGGTSGGRSSPVYRAATWLPVGDGDQFGDARDQRPVALPQPEAGEILYRDPLTRELATTLALADGIQFGDHMDASGRPVCSPDGLGVVIASCEAQRTR